MLDWIKISKAYIAVKNGVIKRADGDGYKIYDMKNGTIRIDIKEGDCSKVKNNG